ncbi:DNA repair and recombination protein RAD54B [Frankliniella fusca]|uniref:DNA repair and recombination protein RAD54-like n=1 Tax=Frankliniella fusca TaxID=407009 RepID=A0AAE1GSI5_9NEOP|nr:DNA repair and recombination protein RAD54B [Frankliniella fusca]
MRRSAAPSFRHSQLGMPNSSNAVSSSTGAPAARSTASVLNLLCQQKRTINVPTTETIEDEDTVNNFLSKEDIPSQPHKSRSESSTPSSSVGETSGEKRVFRVVWGKPTTKKHKTWEGDGTLEIGQKTATLMDEEGKVIGRATQVKSAELEEGSRLKVGSKEVELVDLLSGPPKTHANSSVLPGPSSSKRCASELSDSPPQASWKKPKKKPNNALIKFTTEGYDTLILPSPSHDHQWTFNTKKLPVTPVAVDSFLNRVLRPHQREGVTFLYECVMGMKNIQHFGAILADEMGLGKTLQTISLLWTLLRQGPYGGNPVVRRALIVSPSSLVLNWQKEFNRWLGKERLRTFAVDQKNKVAEFARLTQIPVMLISYEMLMRNFDDISKIKFDILVCDEGHRLKNNNIRTSVLLNQLDIKSRILLTGTPIQNDLQEYYALVNFVNPGILGTAAEFRRTFEEPIVASRQPRCSFDEQCLGEERASELNSKTACFILRRTQAVINQYLPTKTEVVIFVKPVNIQKILCRAALDWWINRDTTPGHSDGESLLKELSDMYDASENGAVAVHHSAKLNVVRRLLEHLITIGERVVLVSYFTQTLNLMASLCDEMGLNYCRLDGATPANQRSVIVDEFNSTYSRNIVFLLSARAGGVGLNLTGASRLVLFDSDWNPATDAQAMSRIWRDGQKKSVFIYRLLTCGTIEEKIFQRQLSKAGLSGAVVDPQKQSNIKLSQEELKDLFTFHEGNESLTHCSLGCNCDGRGTVPSIQDIPFSEEKENDLDGDEDDRDCQLFIRNKTETNRKKDSAPDLRMNQLFEWQHHAPPFQESSLQALGLTHASELLAFMFVSPPAIEQSEA